MTAHTCHWPGCGKRVPPKLWGCKQHWFALPKDIRDRIWATYRPGQEVTKTPSRDYVAAARAARDWIEQHMFPDSTPRKADDLFPGTKPPRSKPRVMMHFTDTGSGAADELLATFQCSRCGTETEWLIATSAEIRRGIPCEQCNATENPVTVGIDRTTSGAIGQP